MLKRQYYYKAAYEKALLAARCDGAVLIVGETGVGKEVLAKHIHEQSDRGDSTFVPINCTSISSALFESELFGHTKGAFTGAIESMKGLVGTADHGTLFLDEVSGIPIDLQVRLLRVIETKEFYRLGDPIPKKADFRLICASNRALAELRDGQFIRKDFFYRINTFTIEIPPLRERKDEIPGLADHFLKSSYSHAKLSQGVLELLLCYPFPGNIRELKSSIEYALSAAGEGASIINVEHLPERILDHCGLVSKNGVPKLKDMLACFSRTYISQIVKKHDGDINGAAEELGVSRATICRAIVEKDR